MKEAILKVTEKLVDSYALAVMYSGQPERIFTVRQDSPLVVGRGAEGENYIASDIPAFLEFTDDFYILDDGEIAEVSAEEINIFDSSGQKINKDIFEVDWDAEMAEKNGYPHYMLKEIHEQPDALRKIMRERVSPGQIDLTEVSLPDRIDDIQIVACGTASYAGQVGKYVLEELTRISGTGQYCFGI